MRDGSITELLERCETARRRLADLLDAAPGESLAERVANMGADPQVVASIANFESSYPDAAAEQPSLLAAIRKGATFDIDGENFKEYWTTGPGALRIGWGLPGDLTRCHNAVAKEAGADALKFDVWGYCQNLHKRKFGVPNPESGRD